MESLLLGRNWPLVHHGKSSHESTLFQASPLKFLGHGSGAAVMAEVLKDIPSCISLDHLQLVDVDFDMRLHTVEAYSSCGLMYVW